MRTRILYPIRYTARPGYWKGYGDLPVSAKASVSDRGKRPGDRRKISEKAVLGGHEQEL